MILHTYCQHSQHLSMMSCKKELTTKNRERSLISIVLFSFLSCHSCIAGSNIKYQQQQIQQQQQIHTHKLICSYRLKWFNPCRTPTLVTTGIDSVPCYSVLVPCVFLPTTINNERWCRLPEIRVGVAPRRRVRPLWSLLRRHLFCVASPCILFERGSSWACSHYYRSSRFLLS